MTPVACRYCGRPIVWGVDHIGTRIPLDPSAPVYEAVSKGDTGFEVLRVAKMGDSTKLGFGFAVSHFSTCSKASEASADAADGRQPVAVPAGSKAPPIAAPRPTVSGGGPERDG